VAPAAQALPKILPTTHVCITTSATIRQVTHSAVILLQVTTHRFRHATKICAIESVP